VHSAFSRFLVAPSLFLAFFASASAQGTPQDGADFSQNSQIKPLPADTIIVKGAWASASDSVIPLPEGGTVAENAYTNPYFGLTYVLPPGWTQKYYGPPPSDTGYYVLAQIRPGNTAETTNGGSILIAAQDLFFTARPAANAFELAADAEKSLQADYQVERPVTPVIIAYHSFVRFDYLSPVAELHWYVLATQIRCHLVQFVFTSRDAKWMETLIHGMDKMQLPAEASPILGTGGGGVPVCIKDYARPENVLERVDPVFTERRFNPIPVRIIIGKDGKVKHIHFLSAFPDQAKSITDALSEWRFKPYVRDGQAVEVETGIMFGHAPAGMAQSASDALTE
jgi:hypothetical protein